ncbi:hypothetical protein B0H10DRAFT_2214658 [Mycena sp. CBHHK59/15]|nr:hypothetical protein B0H10DRAFT_2214658 [Mycena sp. CBHHK59/15]
MYTDIDELFNQHEEDIAELTTKHEKKPEYIRALLTNTSQYKSTRQPNLRNTIIHDLSVKATDEGHALKLPALQAMADKILIMELSEAEEEHLITQLQDHRDLHHMGLHASNIAAATNARGAITRLQQEIMMLYERTGTRAIAFFTHGHIDDTIMPSYAVSGDTMDFFLECQKLHIAGIDVLYKMIKNWTIHMSYMYFDVDICEAWKVDIEGWDADSIPFTNPLDLCIEPLHRLHDGWCNGSIKWVYMKLNQITALNKDLETRQAAGENLKMPRNRRSDVGGKHCHCGNKDQEEDNADKGEDKDDSADDHANDHGDNHSNEFGDASARDHGNDGSYAGGDQEHYGNGPTSNMLPSSSALILLHLRDQAIDVGFDLLDPALFHPPLFDPTLFNPALFNPTFNASALSGSAPPAFVSMLSSGAAAHVIIEGTASAGNAVAPNSTSAGAASFITYNPACSVPLGNTSNLKRKAAKQGNDAPAKKQRNSKLDGAAKKGKAASGAADSEPPVEKVRKVRIDKGIPRAKPAGGASGAVSCMSTAWGSHNDKTTELAKQKMQERSAAWVAAAAQSNSAALQLPPTAV